MSPLRSMRSGWQRASRHSPPPRAEPAACASPSGSTCAHRGPPTNSGGPCGKNALREGLRSSRESTDKIRRRRPRVRAVAGLSRHAEGPGGAPLPLTHPPLPGRARLCLSRPPSGLGTKTALLGPRRPDPVSPAPRPWRTEALGCDKWPLPAAAGREGRRPGLGPPRGNGPWRGLSRQRGSTARDPRLRALPPPAGRPRRPLARPGPVAGPPREPRSPRPRPQPHRPALRADGGRHGAAPARASSTES